MPVVEEARAKVNLALHVTGWRPDGYHDLDMLVAFADVGDTVTVAGSDKDQFDIRGPMAGGLDGTSDNLVLRALHGFRQLTGQTEPVAIDLVKRLPIASGIGGGSADAAATLRALCRLHAHPIDEPPLAALALSLGADVPMCLDGRSAHVTGIGERITPTSGRLAIGLLLVNPRIGISTATAFRELQSPDNPPLPDLPAFGHTADLATFLAEETRNDLEPVARRIAPVVADVLAALATLPGVRLVRMSGSGATCFGLFDDRDAAAAACQQLAASHPGWWVAPAVARF